MIADLNEPVHADEQAHNEGQITQLFLSLIKAEEEKRLAVSLKSRNEIRNEIEAEILTIFYKTLNKD